MVTKYFTADSCATLFCRTSRDYRLGYYIMLIHFIWMRGKVEAMALCSYPVCMPQTKRQCMKCHWLFCLGVGFWGWREHFLYRGFGCLAFGHRQFVPRSFLQGQHLNSLSISWCLHIKPNILEMANVHVTVWIHVVGFASCKQMVTCFLSFSRVGVGRMGPSSEHSVNLNRYIPTYSVLQVKDKLLTKFIFTLIFFVTLQIRQKVLPSAYTRALRDPFPPARQATLLAMQASVQYFPLQVCVWPHSRLYITKCAYTHIHIYVYTHIRIYTYLHIHM